VNGLGLLKQEQKHIFDDIIQKIGQLEAKNDVIIQNQEKAGQKDIQKENQSIVERNSSSGEENKEHKRKYSLDPSSSHPEE
jgi:hypothetical protein